MEVRRVRLGGRVFKAGVELISRLETARSPWNASAKADPTIAFFPLLSSSIGDMSESQNPRNYYVAQNATIMGDVTIGEQASFWFNAVVRGDVAPVTVGRRANVQDGAIIHCDSGVPNVIEDDVTIGHRAVVHGMFVGRGSLIGIGAILLGRTRIGSECLIAAGAVVPPGLEVPDRMVVMGVPGRIVRAVREEELNYLRWLTPHYVELAEKHLRKVNCEL
jgi:carbonic anhydrase/acetyltransferase-like protein (isoleucine patch superfamily)